MAHVQPRGMNYWSLDGSTMLDVTPTWWYAAVTQLEPFTDGLDTPAVIGKCVEIVFRHSGLCYHASITSRAIVLTLPSGEFASEEALAEHRRKILEALDEACPSALRSQSIVSTSPGGSDV